MADRTTKGRKTPADFATRLQARVRVLVDAIDGFRSTLKERPGVLRDSSSDDVVLHVSGPSPGATQAVYVTGIPGPVTEREVETLLETLGGSKPHAVFLVGEPGQEDRFALVEFPGTEAGPMVEKVDGLSFRGATLRAFKVASGFTRLAARSSRKKGAGGRRRSSSSSSGSSGARSPSPRGKTRSGGR